MAWLESYQYAIDPTLSRAAGELGKAVSAVKKGKRINKRKLADTLDEAADVMDASAGRLAESADDAAAKTPDAPGGTAVPGKPVVDAMDDAARERAGAGQAPDAGGKPPARGEREVARFVDSLTRDIDAGIQKALAREAIKESRATLKSMADEARDLIRQYVKSDGSDSAAREALDLKLREMREFSNRGEVLAGDLSTLFERRMTEWAGRRTGQAEGRIAKAEERAQRIADSFMKDVEERIARHDRAVADQAARDRLHALRDQANDLLKQMRADPNNPDLRKAFFNVTQDLYATTRGGAQEATKYMDLESLQDERLAK
jgi:hypothetical protein